VNEGKLAPGGRLDARRVALLKQWVDAGLELGNHSYSHFDLHTTPLAKYSADVARGDSVTRALLAAAGKPAPTWFRHPMLHTGRDSATRAKFEQSIAARGYRVAPVTIDNNEYIFAAAYERADSATAAKIGEDYVAYMHSMIAYYEDQSVALFGREIRQVLLLHANAINADHFDEIGRTLLMRGYRFVPIARAVEDKAYRSRDTYTGPAGITWIHRWALTAGKRGSFFAKEPEVPEYVVKLSGIAR
jgi:peptidoglycan/xylan/chitin deacetylase (PgdA/CDA1 family)